MVYPLKLNAIYKEKIWGGRYLEKYFNKKLPPKMPIGESWELCVHKDGTSIVANGIYEGRSITEVFQAEGKSVLGKNTESYLKKFPLLFKYIDANEILSIQVHPEDSYAMEDMGELGKTEMWYIVDAEPGSTLVFGTKAGINKASLTNAVQEGNIKGALREVQVSPGDVFYIPAGTIHAIGKGIVLAEIQQNSNATYRLYDWQRNGLDGKPRAVHLERALQVISYSDTSLKDKVIGLRLEGEGYKSTIYVCCSYFTTELLEIDKCYKGYLQGEEFEVLMLIDGKIEIIYDDNKMEVLNKGETMLLPASLGGYRIIGKGKVLKVYIERTEKLYMKLRNIGYKDEEIKKIAGL